MFDKSTEPNIVVLLPKKQGMFSTVHSKYHNMKFLIL